MLERASTCIETGGRQLFRAPKRCLRSRRTLHSFFWHHGASDLLLPIWWASSSMYIHANGDVDHRQQDKTTTSARQNDGPLLEFLYPEKTLALIQRWSAYGSDGPDTRRRAFKGSYIRRFSTSRWQPAEEEALEDPDSIQAREEMDAVLMTRSAADALQDILNERRPGKQELAWHIYSAVSERSRTPRMGADLLEYLVEQDMSRAASRLLRVFESIPVEDRRATSYRTAISAYVALKMVGPAIQLQEEAAARFDSIDIGTDAILKRVIEDDQWDLSLRVYKTFLQQASRLNINININVRSGPNDRAKSKAVFGQVAQVSDLEEHLHSLRNHIRQFQHELNSTAKNKKALALFVTRFVAHVIDEVLQVSEPDEDHIWNFFVDLFRDLRSLDLPTSYLYEYSIMSMIDTPRYRQYMNGRKVFLELYRDYHRQSLEESTMRPSRYIISRLIVQHGEKGGIDRVGELVNDLRTIHSTDPFTPQCLTYLVRCFAKHGLADRVHEFIGEIQTRFPVILDLKMIISLVYVYARRIDVSGAVHQFKRINAEFGLTPDTACWNTLLLAFTKADDLDGALECFNNCLESGVQPDIYTFGPMLDLCAARGDVEAFEALFSRAKQLKIPVDSDRWARSGYVQAFLNTGDAEGAEAIAHGMHQSWLAGTLRGDSLTHTWNLLISHYGVTGDLTNSNRLYRQMRDYQIPLDSWTYGALMRALIQANQTNAAYKIITDTMPKNSVQVHAFHYAIVITGFLNETQYGLAQKAYKRMRQRRLPQTEASRKASLLFTGIQELIELRKQKVGDPKARLIAVEQQLRESLLANYGAEVAHDQPAHNRYIDSPELSSVPQGYFALVIMLYTARGAYDICKQLFEAASKSKSGGETHGTPISLLTAIMETHQKAHEWAEVEKCWELARSEANRLVKTFQQVMHPEPPSPNMDHSLTDPAVKARHDAAHISINRRQILFRAARTYIRSLLEQGDKPGALAKAQRTIRDLLTSGFVIDNATWNSFIQHLTLRGRTIDAFSACEMYLMPEFPGWQTLNPAYIRRSRPGHDLMDLKHYDITKSKLLPRYKTLVVMAAAYAQAKRDERNGIGYNPNMGGWPREVLEQIAPLTVRAIDTMPRTGDNLQQKYLLGL